MIPKALENLIKTISYLPWIWEKSAQKIAFFLLNSNKNYTNTLAQNILNIKENISFCKNCNCLIDKNETICSICWDDTRQKNIICVVEDYLDMITIENLKVFNWVYHILGWAISPINWIFIWDLNFESLFKKIETLNTEIELIIATNPNIEWEATSMYIKEEIEKRRLKKFVKLTRLSRWLSSWYIEYADNITLINSLKDRKEM